MESSFLSPREALISHICVEWLILILNSLSTHCVYTLGMQSNIGVQTAIVLCSALAMGGMSFVGHDQAQKSNYNPSLMPSLNVVASALLLTILIS